MGVPADHAGPAGASLFAPATDERVWRAVLTMYVGAGVLFLVNNVLGFLNVLDAPAVPRWQALMHLHAGTIGWITLSVIATTVWVFIGDRRVADGLASRIRALTAFALVSFGGYIVAFALAFGRRGDAWWLLPIFGTAAALVITSTFVFALTQLRHQRSVTTTHLLLTGGLLTATLGALAGVLIGLRYAGVGGLESLESFTHPLTMDIYFVLVMTGLVEAHVRPHATRIRWHGWLQSALFMGAALVAYASMMAGVEAGLNVAFPLFLLGVLVFLIRMAWRPLAVNPFRGGHHANLFWGGLGLIAFIAIFIAIPSEDEPYWMLIAFVHLFGVGTATNLLLATQSRAAGGTGGWVEPTAAWVMNLGLIAFIGGAMASERVDGAAVMGIGVVAAVLSMLVRLVTARRGPRAPSNPSIV